MAIDMLLSGVAEPGLEGHVSWSTLGVHLWKGSPHKAHSSFRLTIYLWLNQPLCYRHKFELEIQKSIPNRAPIQSVKCKQCVSHTQSEM